MRINYYSINNIYKRFWFYKYLLPKYPKFNDVQIKLIAVGTGQAIINAKNCDGGILIVHDKKREDEFMANGLDHHDTILCLTMILLLLDQKKMLQI